jgi:uncharacterized membrane protein
MSKAAHIAWLYSELPDLVTSGLITEAVAEGLMGHYGPVEDPSEQRRNRLLTIFGGLGALLVGLGIILLVAFNWEALSRPARAALSLLPLVGGQAILAYTLWRRPRSTAWREGSALFLFIAVGASMALISQTYQFGGSVETWLLTWMLLGLPLVYLAGATLPALGYVAGVMSWATMRAGEPRLLAYSLLLALVLPHLILRLRADRAGTRGTVLLWFLTAASVEWMGLYLDGFPDAWVPLAIAAGLALLHLADGFIGHEGDLGLWHRPFQVLGAVGLVILGLVASSFSFELWQRAYFSQLSATQAIPLLAILAAGAFFLLWRSSPERRHAKLPLGLLPLSIAAGLALTAGLEEGPTLAALLLNLHLLAAGLWLILQGTRRGSLGTANGGLGIIILLIFFRFFEVDVGLVGRGLAFITLGITFILANAYFSRRMRS